MPWAAIIGAGASLLGGSNAADAASQAADVQAKSAEKAIEEQRRQFDLVRSDNAPFMQNGVAGNNRLAYLLGLNPGGGGGGGTVTAPGAGSTASMSRDQVRSELLGKGGYTTGDMRDPSFVQDGIYWGADRPGSAYGGTTTDETRLNTDTDARMAQMAGQGQQSQQAAQTAAASDPAYGSLLKRFSSTDLAADPVHNSGLQFGLDQGTGAINARAIAGGGYDSGATIKALTRYASDYGSTKANESYNRFNTDNTNIYNRLGGISGTGQTATNSVTTAGSNIANNISGLTTDAGSARSAGIVGGANAWGGALGGVGTAANNYTNAKWLKGLMGGNGGSGMQAAFSNTSLGRSGFGSGLAYGNQDLGSEL